MPISLQLLPAGGCRGTISGPCLKSPHNTDHCAGYPNLSTPTPSQSSAPGCPTHTLAMLPSSGATNLKKMYKQNLFRYSDLPETHFAFRVFGPGLLKTGNNSQK